QQDHETARHDLITAGWQHFPMKGDDVAQRAGIACDAKAMAAVAHVLVVRSCDPALERLVPARLALSDVMAPVWDPELRDPPAMPVGVGFVPDRNVSFCQGLCVHARLSPKRFAAFAAGDSLASHGQG